jgi:hypothetical protein
MLLVKEVTALGSFVNTAISKAIDSIRSVSSIQTGLKTQKSIESTAVTIISQLAEFSVEYTAKVLSGKPGIYRKQINGVRSNFSGRAVITSITKAHNREELWLPWELSVEIFSPMISSMMLYDGYLPGEINKYLSNSIIYESIIRPYIEKYILLERGGIIPSLFGRNPTLKHGSIQAPRDIRVKQDTDDPTISMSILLVRQYNSDFDGDEMNLRISIDEREGQHFLSMQIDNTIVSHSRPRTLDSTACLHIQSAATLCNYIDITDKLALERRKNEGT